MPYLSVLKLLQLLSRAFVIAEKLEAEPIFTDPTDLGQRNANRRGFLLDQDFDGDISSLLKRGAAFDGTARSAEVNKPPPPGRPISQESNGKLEKRSWARAETHMVVRTGIHDEMGQYRR